MTRRIALLVATSMVLASPAAARADGVAIGAFLGEPTGFYVLLGLRGRAALDIVLGVTSLRDGGRDTSYGHVTYLHTLTVARGRAVRVPVRVGIGGALSSVVEGNVQVAARAPLQVGLQFRGSGLELYGELSFVLRLIDDVDADVDGGIGLRVAL